MGLAAGVGHLPDPFQEEAGVEGGMEEAVFRVELGSLGGEEVETACLCVLSRSLTKTGRRGSAGLITGAFF